MIMIDQNMPLKEYQKLIASNPMQANFFRRTFADTYDGFVDVFYDDLDLVVSQLESNPQLYRDDGEDKLTGIIVSNLVLMGYAASHGTTGGGAKDFTVIGKNPTWTWIGEAKIFDSVANLREGFLQLITRYRNSNAIKARGGFLAYTFRPKAAALLKGWTEEAQKMGLDNLKVTDCSRRPGLAFHTEHDHEATGLPFDVRHLAVALYFQPKDKSGRTAKKFKATAAKPAKAAA
jgi:hypothetical protein